MAVMNKKKCDVVVAAICDNSKARRDFGRNQSNPQVVLDEAHEALKTSAKNVINKPRSKAPMAKVVLGDVNVSSWPCLDFSRVNFKRSKFVHAVRDRFGVSAEAVHTLAEATNAHNVLVVFGENVPT